MINQINLLNTKFDNIDIITQYIEFINANKLPQDTERSEVYYEVHHILPKSLFPEYEYEPTNLVKLKLYDHFVAHYIIAKTKNPKMLYAFNMMNRAKTSMNDSQLDSAAKMYEELKSEFVEVVREQALNRPPMSKETKGKIGKATKDTVQILGQRISQEEYHSNPEKYVHHMSGTNHSEETEQKMSENGIKGKVCFHHIKTLETRYEDESFSEPMWKQGNPIQSVLAKERFTNQLHWTNIVTGEGTRAKVSPGPDWIQKRANFKNAFSGKSMMVDIRTGEKVLIDKSDLEIHHCVHNKVIIETPTSIIVDIVKHINDLGLNVGRAEFISYIMKRNSVPKKYLLTLSKNNLSGYKITNPKSLTYPHSKEIL